MNACRELDASVIPLAQNVDGVEFTTAPGLVIEFAPISSVVILDQAAVQVADPESAAAPGGVRADQPVAPGG